MGDPTKPDQIRPHEVSDRQSIAIDALIGGATHREAAEKASVQRSTVTAWCNYNTPFKARLNARRQQRLQMGGEQLQEALGTSIPYGVGSHPVLRYRPAHHRSANRVAAPPRSRWSGVDTSSRTPHMSSTLNSSTLSPAAGFDTTPIAAYGMSSSLARATSG